MVILTMALLLSGCAKSGSPAPAWPEQPNPSYPDPTAASEEAPDAPTKELYASPSEGSAKTSTLAKEYKDKPPTETLTGKATYYADSLSGNHTANGDVYDPKEFTAAHKKLPFGTILRVIREDTGSMTYVRVNDRGPFGSQDRIIDLSRAAAEELDMMKAGVVSVRVEVLETPKK